ncbi:hypothetical protein BC835DRAFT_1304269 [Cytidiella melzeri]|nr:hypothetical protein BC835DRAFT_1304269 [Cytidiella melzeri]
MTGNHGGQCTSAMRYGQGRANYPHASTYSNAITAIKRYCAVGSFANAGTFANPPPDSLTQQFAYRRDAAYRELPAWFGPSLRPISDQIRPDPKDAVGREFRSSAGDTVLHLRDEEYKQSDESLNSALIRESSGAYAPDVVERYTLCRAVLQFAA